MSRSIGSSQCPHRLIMLKDKLMKFPMESKQISCSFTIVEQLNKISLTHLKKKNVVWEKDLLEKQLFNVLMYY